MELCNLSQSHVCAAMEPLVFRKPPYLSRGWFGSPPYSASRGGSEMQGPWNPTCSISLSLFSPHMAGLEVLSLTFLSCWEGMSRAASFPVSLTHTFCKATWQNSCQGRSFEAKKNIWKYNSKLLSLTNFRMFEFSVACEYCLKKEKTSEEKRKFR